MTRINGHKALSPRLFFFLLFVPTLTFSFMYFPLTGAKVIGSDGYLAIPIAFLFTVPLLLIAAYFNSRYPGLTIIDYTPLVLGRFLGLVCNLLYLAVYFMITVILLRDAIGLAYGFLLNRTPFFFVNLLMVGAALYLSYYGISSIARLASFLLPAVVFLGLVVLLSYQNWQVINTLPLFRQPLYTYIRGGALSLYIFYPLGLLFQAAATLPPTPNHLSKMEKTLAKQIKEEAEKLIRRLQAANSDLIGLGRVVRASHSGEWSAEYWRKLYPTLRINVNVDFTITRTGSFN